MVSRWPRRGACHWAGPTLVRFIKEDTPAVARWPREAISVHYAEVPKGAFSAVVLLMVSLALLRLLEQRESRRKMPLEGREPGKIGKVP